MEPKTSCIDVAILIRLTLLAVTLTTLCILSHVAKAQERGFQPGASYALSDIEAINASNGNMIVQIPLASLPPGRGGVSGPELKLVYNSKLYETHTEEIPDEGTGQNVTQIWLNPGEAGGWRYITNFGYQLKLISRTNLEGSYPCVCDAFHQKNAYIWKFMVIFPDGGEHEFRPLGYTDLYQDGYYDIDPHGTQSATSCVTIGPETASCGFSQSQATTNGMTYYSTDGTFMRLFVPHTTGGDFNSTWANNWTLSFPDGKRLIAGAGSQTMFDRNNNIIPIGTQDTLGRQITMQHSAATDEDVIFVIGANQQQLQWIVKWKTVYVSRQYTATTAGGGRERGNTYTQVLTNEARVVDRITLPAQAGGLTYVFGYSASDTDPYPGFSPGWGELNAITLPTGAQAHYTWAFDGNGDRLAGRPPNWDWVLNNHPTRKDLTHLRQYDGTSTPTTETWTYAGSFRIGAVFSVTAPDGGVTTTYSYAASTNSPFIGYAYKTEHPDGSVTESVWKQNRPQGIPVIPKAVNPYVQREFHSIRDAAGVLTKSAIKEYNYDKNGNVTIVKEYDWVDYGSLQRDTEGNFITPASAVLKKRTTSTYYNETPDATDSTTNSGSVYYASIAPQLLTAQKDTEISAGGAALIRTEFFYDNPLTTGNLTQRKSWDSTKGAYTNPLGSANSISVVTQYNQYGSPTLMKDANGIQTEFFYGLVGSVSDLYPTQIKTAFGTSVQRTETRQYDFNTALVTIATDVDNNVSTITSYDDLGRPVLVRAAADLDEETQTSTQYFDSERRVVVRSDLDSTGDGKLVTIQHYDQLGRIRLSRKLEDAATQSPAVETHGIKVQTRYLFGGSNAYVLASNPYRAAFSSDAGGEETMGWTRSMNDMGGRLIEVQTFGGAGLPEPWGTNATSTGKVTTAYDADFTTVTDQAGKVRRSMTNGLGQLARVDEPDAGGSLGLPESPAQPTSYSYDALGNLRQVTQGQQQRFFGYDSLSRLIHARNPEQKVNPALNLTDSITGNSQWSLAYVYDNNGNLLTKKDARNITSSYVYDALNRVTRRSYDDGTPPNFTDRTPAVTYSYDSTIANGKGRLASISSSVSSYSVSSYDAMGRVLGGSQTIGNQIYTIGYSYDLAGHAKSMTYPSDKKVNYSYDAAGRLNDFRGNLGDATQQQRIYSTGITYDSNGVWTREQFGTTTPLYNKRHYNNRQQLYDMRVSTVNDDTNWNRGKIVNYYSLNNFVVGGTGLDTNGNLYVQEHWIPSDDQMSSHTIHQQNYTYDSLNRISSVREYLNGNLAQDTGSQTYTYDRYGNRTMSGSDAGINNLQFDNAEAQFTNRVFAPGDMSVPMSQRRMQYDAAGNLTTDTYSGKALTRAYDAENRMTSETQASFVAGYSYDGAGRRVKRNLNGTPTWQVYGMGGELLAEYAENAAAASPQKEYGYRNGELLVEVTAATAGWGTPPVINDYPLNPHFPGETTIQARHITELRTAINALRTHMGRSNYIWVNSATTNDWISANPILEMRTALDLALGEPAGGYSPGLARELPVKAIHIQELRDRVLNAWNNGSGGTDIRWLVTDHLGTPRMIFGQTGSLANVSRHDYLPFGEELADRQGGRTPEQGYVADGIRQKLTSKERDSETGLDFFGTRSYASTQGRFTSADSASPELSDPQTLNKYLYCFNNPLRYVDPDGKYGEDVHYKLTRILALAAGFSERQANRIAKNTQASDEDPKKAPDGLANYVPFGDPVERRALYHFTTYERRQVMWNAFGWAANGGDEDQTLMRLGEYIHAVQDSYSHAGYGPRTGQVGSFLYSEHGLELKLPSRIDETDYNPSKADRMAKNVFDQLLKANAKMNGGGARVSWDRISPLISQFNTAKTSEEKAKIIYTLYFIIVDRAPARPPSRSRRRTQETIGTHDGRHA
jgi:RHS repeat-associated protein